MYFRVKLNSRPDSSKVGGVVWSYTLTAYPEPTPSPLSLKKIS